MLSEEEKYEIGSILSKIRYMGKEFTQHEFIEECCRLIQGENVENTHLSSYQTFKPNRGSDCKQNIPFANIKFEEKMNQDRKYLRENRNSINIGKNWPAAH